MHENPRLPAQTTWPRVTITSIDRTLALRGAEGAGGFWNFDDPHSRCIIISQALLSLRPCNRTRHDTQKDIHATSPLPERAFAILEFLGWIAPADGTFELSDTLRIPRAGRCDRLTLSGSDTDARRAHARIFAAESSVSDEGS